MSNHDHHNHDHHNHKKEEKGSCCSQHGQAQPAKEEASHGCGCGHKKAHQEKEAGQGSCCSTHKHEPQEAAHGSCCSTHKQEEPKKHAHGACCSTHKHGHHAKASVDAPAGTIFLCPMHLEIRQVGPGTCPICGMALEPEIMTGDEGPNHELIDMTRRFWIGLVLTLPVFVLEMGSHLMNPQSEYVHLDCHRNRCGMVVQCGRNPGTKRVP